MNAGCGFQLSEVYLSDHCIFLRINIKCYINVFHRYFLRCDTTVIQMIISLFLTLSYQVIQMIIFDRFMLFFVNFGCFSLVVKKATW
jgi:hypothetical protein